MLALGLMIHHIEDKAIERQDPVVGRYLPGGTFDIALPLAHVEFGENGVMKNSPSGMECQGEANLRSGRLVARGFHNV